MRTTAVTVLALVASCSLSCRGVGRSDGDADADSEADADAEADGDDGDDGGGDADADLDAGSDADLDADADPDGDETADCPADPVAPNQSQEDAYLLTADEDIDGLVVCAGADDWFRLELAEGLDMQLDVCGADGSASGLGFEFFRAEFPEPDYYLGGGGGGCLSTAVWQAPGTYLYRAFTDRAERDYSVRLYLAETVPWSCPCDSATECVEGVCVCRADELEPNDSRAEAAAIELGRLYELITCVGDPDWVAVDLEAGSRLQIHLATSPVVGVGYFVAATVFDSATATDPVAFFPKGTPSEDFVYDVPASGTYFVLVDNRHSHGRSYELQLDLTP